ncbi:MAG: von Willebrand factor type A domain-containing protein [Tabrizicola sp.]|jgi:Ca-activated chloride channel family protein|nr:von Willebrand factor type A domain-containing protein [Tabrizicola sp.]
MTDDLDDLRMLLKAAPAPEADAKARAMALAMENFDRLQGSADAPRSSEDRTKAAPQNGVRRMFKFLTSRPALAISTSAAALLIGVAVILPVTDLRTGPTDTPVATAKPKVAEADPASPDTGDVAAVTERNTTPPGTMDAPPLPKANHETAEANLDRATGNDLASSVATAEPAPVEPMADVLPEAEPEAEASLLAEEALPAAPATNGGESELSDPAAIALAPMMEGDAELRLRMEAPAEAIGGTLGYVTAEPVVAPVPELVQPQLEDTEAYATEAPNPVKVTAEEPVSTFSIDVDTASWAVIRSTLNMAVLPTPDQVRIEEMVNYFPYAYKAPTEEEAFASTISVMPTPWNPGTRLVTIGIQGALPAVTERPPLNLVFLIDTSGSMEDPNKLPLLKQSLSLLLAELRPEDQVAIVAYAGSAGQVLPPTAAADRAAIMAALDNLASGGSTAGAEGLELAYQVAEGMKADGEVSRILLATDGDFNVGVSDPEGLEAYVAKKRETGTYLSVLGFGRGNLDDAIMQSLAQNGNGTAAYIDTLSEARKVLVDQLTGALFPIADDVKIQVEWNPATVAEYRLIGYETRSLRREDFNNDAVDAGEIGAGTQVTAIYEITAPGSDALLNDPLRYGAATAEGTEGELGFLRLRWKAPGEEQSTLVETPITGTEEATAETRFAAAIAGFGQLLQGSVYTGDWGWDQAIDLAVTNRGDDPYGYRIEAVNLMRLAQSLSAN